MNDAMEDERVDVMEQPALDAAIAAMTELLKRKWARFWASHQAKMEQWKEEEGDLKGYKHKLGLGIELALSGNGVSIQPGMKFARSEEFQGKKLFVEYKDPTRPELPGFSVPPDPDQPASPQQVENVTEDLAERAGGKVIRMPKRKKAEDVAGPSAPPSGEPAIAEELIDQATKTLRETGRGTVTILQRRLKLNYVRAAAVMDELEKRGVVGPANGREPREIMPF